MDNPGRMTTTRQELATEGTGYFNDLFNERETMNGCRCFPMLVFDDMNQWLCRLPLEMEVAENVSSLSSNKSLDPNDFIGGFFKRF